jgi:hypothetical protein
MHITGSTRVFLRELSREFQGDADLRGFLQAAWH